MSIEIIGKKLPIIQEGDNLPKIIEAKFHKKGDEVLIISETIVSKSKGRTKKINKINSSKKAKELAKKTKKDPRICELVITEAEEILGYGKGFVITEKNGLVCANAGIDSSNAGEGKVVLPLKNPKETAKEISEKLETPVIISDSVGRPFRNGAVGLAKSHSGIKAFSSYVGKFDLFGKEMETTKECVVDELASAANLVLGESDNGTPLAIIRGFKYNGEPCEGTINRDKEESIFR